MRLVHFRWLTSKIESIFTIEIKLNFADIFFRPSANSTTSASCKCTRTKQKKLLTFKLILSHREEFENSLSILRECNVEAINCTVKLYSIIRILLEGGEWKQISDFIVSCNIRSSYNFRHKSPRNTFFFVRSNDAGE